MPSEKLNFAGAQGDSLAARLDLPDSVSAENVRAFALFAHCFTCSKDIFAASRISRMLTDHGIAVLRFDFTGLGASDGEFANTNFSSNIGDLLAAVDHLRTHYRAPRILIGHSLGGAAVLAAAGNIPEAVAVATIGAPADPAHLGHLFADAEADMAASGEVEVEIGGRSFRITRQFLDDIGAHNLTRSIAKLKKALIVFHAPRDETVGIENAGEIFAAAKHPKSFVSLDDADHLLSRKSDARYVADIVAAWASRYLDESEQNTAEQDMAEQDMADQNMADSGLPAPVGSVVVAEAGTGKFAQTVRVGRHRLFADEPESIPGGTDTGPSPYDYLLIALGACTAMTLRMYAARKEISLERVAVRLRHDRIHARDCETCETEEGHVDRIRSEIELTGDLDADQRARLLEIAHKCPVHRTLHSEVQVKSRLADAPAAG